jgi:ribosomal protein S16
MNRKIILSDYLVREIMNTEYVQINAQGMSFGRSPRQGGDYEFGSIHSVSDLNIDKKSLKEWVENGTLLSKTKEEYLTSLGQVTIKEVEKEIEEMPDITIGKKEFEEKKEIEYSELRDGKNLDEYWAYSPKISAKKRRCPQEDCKAGDGGIPAIYSNKRDLFECDCKEKEEEE